MSYFLLIIKNLKQLERVKDWILEVQEPEPELELETELETEPEPEMEPELETELEPELFQCLKI